MSPLQAAPPDPGNAMVAHTLHWLAVLLEIDEGPRERVEAWRQAAQAVRRLEEPVAQVARARGVPGLISLGFAPSVAVMVHQWIRTGELPLLHAKRQEGGGLWPALTRALCDALGLEPRRRRASPAKPKPSAPRAPRSSRPSLVRERWH